MGTTAHLVSVVPHDDGALGRATRRIAELERRWSRFRPDSDVATLNRAAGAPVIVSPDTFDLVADAVDAWVRTDGLFDPTVHDALVAAGYDRSFPELPADRAAGAPSGPAPGCGGIELDPVLCAVTLPPGVHLDLGGIGKGRAVDLVTAELDGVTDGSCVNLGGDLRVRGRSPAGAGWSIALDDPVGPPGRAAVATLAVGALVTTTTVRRSWRVGGREQHHLIDPRTGRPTSGDVVTVRVIAAEAAEAEVLAKAALVAGGAEAAPLLERAGVAAEVVHRDGLVESVADWEAYLS